MKKCINCKHLFGRDICYFCDIDLREIAHPFFMGGKKCPCYERYVKKKTKYEYPQKESLEGGTVMNKGLERLKNKNLPCANCKALKALKIIKEKGNFIYPEYNEEYNKYYIWDNEYFAHNEITKEQYDILKEVLE